MTIDILHREVGGIWIPNSDLCDVLTGRWDEMWGIQKQSLSRGMSKGVSIKAFIFLKKVTKRS